VGGSVTDRGKRKELLLIGTVHRDPDGATKLCRLLTGEGPTAVAVEVSPYALYYRRRYGRRLRRQLRRKLRQISAGLEMSRETWGQIQAILTHLQVPFEYTAAQKYCRDKGAELSCLDSSSWSRRWIHTHWQQLLSHENVATLLKQPCQNFHEEIRHSYLLATRLLDDGGQMVASSFIGDWLSDCDWQEREAELAGGLQQMYGRLRKGRLAYVGGWEHLLHTSSTGTLYDRLKHLQPRRVLLFNSIGVG
jgi:hypothetical protein